MNNLTYIWSQGMVDKIAKKVAEEPMENVDEGNYEYHPFVNESSPLPKRPQHVIDEEEVDEKILERHDRRQMEMFDDPWENWSGHR